MSPGARVADALVLMFTPGVSLAEWARTGLLDREWALYESLGASYARVVFVTWGGDEDAAIARGLRERSGVDLRLVSTPAAHGTDTDARAQLVSGVSHSVGDARSVVVKTNQLAAGDTAITIAHGLRRLGLHTALVARGGYHWSRFVARERGAHSEEAVRAAKAEGALVREADAVIGTTTEMLDDLAWRTHLGPERLHLVPNYVDLRQVPEAAAARETGTILFAGRLVPQKRVDLLIDAVAQLPSLGVCAATLTIVGEGPLEGELRARASRVGVEARFEPRLPHRDLLERFRRCTVYAQSSGYEGHPKTVLEAMACGSAVVVTATPGLGSVIDHGVTGIVAAPNPTGVAGALASLLRDRAFRETLGANASSTVAEHGSLERVLPLELTAHRAALARASAAPSSSGPKVTFEPSLLNDPVSETVSAWSRAIGGFARRLAAPDRATFLAALDDPIYQLQGLAAVEANDGLHPKHRLMRYHDFFVDRIKTGERVIDLGCGVGALAASIARRSGAHVTGMDWSQGNLKKAGAAGQDVRPGTVAWTCGDITTDRAPGRFDVLVLSNVLEHLKDRPALLRRYREWYTPARLLIRVPAFDREWRVPWKRELGVEWRLDPTHETEFTEPQLRRELAEAGLRVTELLINWGELWAVAQPA